MPIITFEQINKAIQKNKDLSAKVIATLDQKNSFKSSNVSPRRPRNPFEQEVLDRFKLK